MPITRKLYRRPDGTHVITLPKSWVENAEKKVGKEIDGVLMEVDEAIILTPKFKEGEVKEI